MKALAVLVPVVILTGCATAPSGSIRKSAEKWPIAEILYLAEHKSVAFSSHQSLFVRTLQGYQADYAPGLRVSSTSTTLTAGCDADSTDIALPTTRQESAEALFDLSPLLGRCTDMPRLKERTLAEALGSSILKAVDSELLTPLEYERAAAMPPPQPTANIIESNGYIAIRAFATGTGDAVGSALDGFRDHGLRRLVVDLRGTKGGQLEEIVKSLGQFVTQGTPLFSRLGRAASESADYRSAGPGLPPGTRVAVLVDRSTISGGELAALVLRKRAGAVLVGETTAGKNAIQTVYPLSTGWTVALTTGRWIPPEHAEIPENGIQPDVTAEANSDSGLPESDPVVAVAFAALSR